MKTTVFVGLCILLAPACLAGIITVDLNGSADFDNIQDAIDYSWDGDTVIVNPGIYHSKDIFFNGRAITLTSLDANDPNVVASTIINGTVTFDCGETESSVIQGLSFISGNPLPICTSTYDQSSPAIYGDIVVWQDYRNGNHDIYGYSTQQELHICTADRSQSYPAIYGDIVVWQDDRKGLYHEIYGYNLTTRQEFPIGTSTGTQFSPAIYGDIVVWEDGRNGNADIYGYNLTTRQEFPIGTVTGNQSEPAIYGNIVVWSDGRNGNCDIYGYNLTTRQEFPIGTVTGNQSEPAIYGDIVVWQDYRDGNCDVYGYNLTTQQEFPICTVTGNQSEPAIYGDIVVWQDYRDGNYDIYGYNLTTQQEFPIRTATGDQSSPAIYGNIVVWVDNGNIYMTIPPFMPRIVSNGIVCIASSPTIKNSIVRRYAGYGVSGSVQAMPHISGNDIFWCGVGVYNCDGIINNNSITSSTTAIERCDGSITLNTITGCQKGIQSCTGTIERNRIVNSTTAVSGCSGLFAHNTLTGNTTALVTYTGTITGNVISGGSIAIQNGGGTIVNNTIVGNTNYGLYQCSAVVKNNIIAFNGVGIYGNCSNSYNCFWKNTGGNFASGAYGRTGDFVADPKFASDGNWVANTWVDGDYHLKSTVGRFDPNTATWVIDDVNSPCIDKGDPYTPIGYEPNPNGGRINMGDYGGTAEASKSLSGIVEPVCTAYPAMDFNKDCKVDFQDFAIFCQSWLDCNIDPQSACWE